MAVSSTRAGAAPAAAFGYADGVRVTRAPLWFDAPRVRDSVVVTHAAPTVVPRRARAIMTPGTAAILAGLGRRGAPAPESALLVPFGQPFALGVLRVTLIPSGRLRGAAACLVEAGGERWLYAGRIAPAAGPLAEPLEVRPAGSVAIDATFADPGLAFPPRAEVEGDLVAFAAAAVAAGVTPVVLASALTVAPDLGVVLARAGFSVRAHPRVLAAARALQQAGAPVPAFGRFVGQVAPGEALLWPEDAPLDRARARLMSPRVAWVSPWAAIPAVRPPPCDRCLPLAAAADYPALRRYLAAAGATDVYLLRAPTATVVALAKTGLRVTTLGPPRQLELFPA